MDKSGSLRGEDRVDLLRVSSQILGDDLVLRTETGQIEPDMVATLLLFTNPMHQQNS